MRYYEIIMESEDVLFDEFLKKMANDTNPEITGFLLEHPLYRTMSPSKDWNPVYGIKEIPKERTPVDTPPFIQKIIDEYLKSKGFKAVRSNSIFVTGDINLTKTFSFSGKDIRDIYVIFPQKNFFFTWNPKVRDFFLQNLIISYGGKLPEFDIFRFDLNKMLKNKESFQKIYSYIKEFLKEMKKYPKYKTKASEYMERLDDIMKNNNTKELISFIKTVDDDFTMQSLDKFIQKRIYEDIASQPQKYKKAPDYFVFNPDSEYLKYYTDKNFEEAVKSGNEIFLSDSYFYYIRNDYFKRNYDTIYEKLKKKLLKKGSYR